MNGWCLPTAAIVLDFGFCGFGGIFIFFFVSLLFWDDVRKDLRLSVAYPVGLSGLKIRLQHSTWEFEIEYER